jgi:hypothetical protein
VLRTGIPQQKVIRIDFADVASHMSANISLKLQSSILLSNFKCLASGCPCWCIDYRCNNGKKVGEATLVSLDRS